jgi:hypothetical protein
MACQTAKFCRKTLKNNRFFNSLEVRVSALRQSGIKMRQGCLILEHYFVAEENERSMKNRVHSFERTREKFDLPTDC